MDLTPLDVRKKKEDFKKSVRGYDPEQVETFLDLVADRMEDLVREHRSLSDRVESLREQLGHYQEREKALNEALLAAQELREEARSQAERDAAVRLREAETHAEAILLEADQALRHSQRRLEDVRSRRSQLIRSLRGVANRLLDFLEEEEQRLAAEPDELGDLLEKLETEMAADPAPETRPGVTPERAEGAGNEAGPREGDSPRSETVGSGAGEDRAPGPSGQGSGAPEAARVGVGEEGEERE